MGHYGDQREAHYDELRRESARRAAAALPVISRHLEEARHLLELHKQDIPFSPQVAADLALHIELLTFQLHKAEVALAR